MAAVPDTLNDSSTSQVTSSHAHEMSKDSNAQDFRSDASEVPDLEAEQHAVAEAIEHEGSKDNGDMAFSHEDGRKASTVSLDMRNESGGSSSPNATKSSFEKPKKHSSDGSKKDSRHSSKNEGQHTDRRYLCYVCYKLFTRRRSVRDHINKIHGTKTWEPSRSLEIVVEPITGEPLEPLEEQIAKGGAPPVERMLTHEETEDEYEEHDIEPTGIKAEPSIESRSQSNDRIAPLPLIGKKRPLSINKKGVAKVKTSMPNKRPRITDSEASTPFRSPSVASTPRLPTSKLGRATQSPSSSHAGSRGPSASPSPSVSTPESTNDDGEIFCICRKGDNHTWMIACDGGCEEWFHGNCVNIRERDGELIDKYICPNCRRDGLHTTWKRMCRRKGCRKPARVLSNPPSKYCSRDCGRMFFVEFIKRGDPDVYTTRDSQYIVEMERPKKKRRKRRCDNSKGKQLRRDLTPIIEGSRPHTPAYSDDEKSEYETDSSLDDDMLPNRGGALRAAEVKALVDQCKTIDDWRELGRKPVTPPREPDSMDLDVDLKYVFDDFETEKLSSIEQERIQLTERDTLLSGKEKLLELVKDRSAKIAEEVRQGNPKQKDICGYDSRLAWSDEEFAAWYYDFQGREMLESGKLDAHHSPGEATNGGTQARTNGINGTHVSDDDDTSDGTTALPTKEGVCIKNRCQRHGSNRWQKGQLAELRFEQDLIRRAREKLDVQERSIKERGLVRGWEGRA